ncbi:MAG: hypothetical protein PF495_15680 [Spirochaetales bacterium]|jgi:type II secretory pathway component GspD/PulD (secretin)|nr:hypothetical protein [Spirochaetales bacterium]
MSSGKTIIILLVGLLANGVASASLEGTVKVHAHFVAYPKATIDKLQAEDITKPLDIKILAELLKQGEGRILASPSMVATSNVQSELKDQFDHRLHQDLDIETGQNTSPTIKPSDYEDFGEGLSLTIKPNILDEGKKVHISFSSKLMEKPELVEHNVGSLPTLTGGRLEFFYSQTAIKHFEFKSSAVLKDGETILLSGGATTSGDDQIYIFLTCSIMSTGNQSSEK